MKIPARSEESLLAGWRTPTRRSTPFQLSKKSKARLDGVDKRLVALVEEILHYMDVSVIEGLRSVTTQKYYVSIGVSKTMRSKHLQGKAVDLYPYPVPRLPSGEIDSNAECWDNLGRLGIVLSRRLGISVQWGGLWVSIVDKPHFEIKEN